MFSQNYMTFAPPTFDSGTKCNELDKRRVNYHCAQCFDFIIQQHRRLSYRKGERSSDRSWHLVIFEQRNTPCFVIIYTTCWTEGKTSPESRVDPQYTQFAKENISFSHSALHCSVRKMGPLALVIHYNMFVGYYNRFPSKNVCALIFVPRKFVFRQLIK